MKIFVYGTLKRGHCRAHFLNGQTSLGPARTAEQYRLVDCGEYPGLIESTSGLSIEGEVWDVDDRCLKELDREECIDVGLYARRAIQLLAPHDQDTVQAYFYLGDTRGLPDCGTCWGKSS